ncbi:MAG: sugar phosphate nucleotidyltransferase [Dehalococcoidia bacterium]|nr:sugar phosphate nucleotidyltransferase [Dehalococcoidia bacterium]
MKKVLAIIMAGGNGSRMGVLCSDIPKPMLTFGASCRVIDFTLTNCVRSGFRDILVPVDYRREKMTDYLTKWSLANSMKNELRILEPQNGHYLGTADAIRQNLALIENYKPDIVMILAGDHVYKMDYRDMLDFHISRDANITLSVKPVHLDQASNFGIVNVNSNSEITDFVEKPAVPTGNLASMGIYLFRTDTLLNQLERNDMSLNDFGHDIIPSMIEDGRVMAYQYKGYWRDIGTVDSYYRTNMDLLGYPPVISIEGQWPVLTDSTFSRPVRKYRAGNVWNSIVGASCRIEGRVENCILEDGVSIGHNVTVRNSIVMARASIGDYSVLNHCILDRGAKVDKFCFIGKPGIPLKASDITIIDRDVRISQYESILLKYNNSSFAHGGSLVHALSNYERRPKASRSA